MIFISLFVEVKLLFVLLQVVFVALFKVFWENDIAVLSNGVHSSLVGCAKEGRREKHSTV